MQICDLKKRGEGTGDGGGGRKAQLDLQLMQKLKYQNYLKDKTEQCNIYMLGVTSVDLVIVSFSENNVQGWLTLTAPSTGGFVRFIYREWNPLQPSVFTSQPSKHYSEVHICCGLDWLICL